MKKIVIDARESGTSTGRYIDKLVEYLHKLPQFQGQSYEITLLAKPHRLEFFAEVAPGFTCLPSPHKEFTFAEQLALKKQIEGLRPDLVHFPAVQQPVLYRGNVVTTMQDLTTLRFRNPDKNPVIFKLKQQVYRWLNRQVARKSTLLITPSEFVKQDVVAFSHIDLAKITVTYESADELPTPPVVVEGLSDKRFIMYIGRPTPHKNLERLIEAFGILHKQYPDLQLILAGKKDRNYDRIAALAAQREIGQVVFTGFISDQQLRWLYEHCSAYIFPSLSEGFGLPGVEAMRHGAPLVSSNATCLPEIFGDGAYYFDPLSIQDMASKINDVLSDTTLRDKLVANGRQRAAGYSWQRMAEQTFDVYRKALN